MKKYLLILCFFLLGKAVLFAQTSDDAFKKPLKEVIADVEKQFDVKIRYPEELVAGRMITYAGWRFRAGNLEKTLTNILSSQDLTFAPDGDKRYKIQAFQYHLKTVEEGKQQLEYLASLYSNQVEWEKRKDELKACMLSALHLSPLPAKPASQPIRTPVRKMDGYTVENIAFEVLPGVYINGSLYKPTKIKGKIPVILNPDGHWGGHRFRPDAQIRCAMQARMGAMAVSFDLFAWGESLLQFKPEDHRKSLAQTVQVLSGMRILDYLLSLKEADKNRVAITGGSGGGSQTMMTTAIDDRITLSVPVVMLSSYHSGGCPCESGMGAHLCGGGTNNVEIAAMAAPRPQLVISDGKDWTQNVPKNEFPFLQRVYGFYGKQDMVKNVHLPEEGHDYGLSKRLVLYEFLAQYLGLNINAVKDQNGKIDESKVTIEKESDMYVFGEKGERLPANAIKGYEALQKLIEQK
ncbi:acetylxylan esterase [Chitinophagaceae bacterium LB-8]|uniref:Acetylxylan esterase n=1 Tax=Paraflavisolibacter caeni TaxID=2982496 RepID=A0A9X2XZP3_9BACT|nr:acetylxylan esterase [Paraflavisolibacter caeni]MCU7551905.1 acetylxylan esterase [Paraflavisolibacter caeni]